jgi:type IV secretion system protein VirB11
MMKKPQALTVNMLLNPIQHLLDDVDIDEVTINRPHEIWSKNYKGWTLHKIHELSMAHIQSLITATCAFNAIGESSALSLVMPNGERAQIMKFPALIDGQISFNIRKHGSKVYNLQDLQEQGAFDEWVERKLDDGIDEQDQELLDLKDSRQIKKFLEKCIEYHKNIVIAGATGSGKTTFARAMIQLVPLDERIITIEDVHELFLPHENKLHLMFGHDKGRLSPKDALRCCMRSTPDRIFLAELRGDETWDYINSLNTGHSGSITTVHANNAVQTFDRIATLAKQSETGGKIDLETIMLTLKKTIHVVLYFENRKLKEIYFDPIGAKAA